MEHVPVAVVGGGQAGLSGSFWLSHFDIDHVVFDPARPGDSWRERWDSFTLVTPNWTLDLPGHPYRGDEPDGFLPRDAIVEYVRRFAESVGPSMIFTKVSGLEHRDGWLLNTGDGAWKAHAVIVATGAYPHLHIPGVASGLGADISQLHSQQYRSPDRLPDGRVLVVGSGQSGAQIVDDLTIAGREVWFAAGSAGVAPRTYRGRDIVAWLDALGFFESPATDKSRHAASVMVSGRDGGKSLDFGSFDSAGVRLLGRVKEIENGVVAFANDLADTVGASRAVGAELTSAIDDFIEDHELEAPDPDWSVDIWEPMRGGATVNLRREGVSSVVWSTGYRADYSWIAGLSTDHRGYPIQERGVAAMPGLYFLGLNQMHTIGSSLFRGVGRDAEYVVGELAEFLGRF